MIYKIGKTVVGPVMFDYVMWVLKTAEAKQIEVLYFLARDGYLLHKIAVKICQYYKLNIKCRYLYCSRLSLRMPTYGYIGQEAWDLIFEKSKLLSINVILERLLFTENEKKQLLSSCNIDIDLKKSLSKNEFNVIKQKIINNQTFKYILNKKSQISFENIVSYFRQENIFNYKYIGIVDSGWNGSMQRSLRQIFDRANVKIKISGFYFGSFFNKHDYKDGEYLNWYFSDNDGLWRKIFFCNNVIEAFLSAPHGMTLSYSFTGSKWIPNLKNEGVKKEFYNDINKLDNGCIEYVEEMLLKTDFYLWNNVRRVEESYTILRRFMVFPARDEVEGFNKFMFCDDLSESYENSLSGKEHIKSLSNFSIPKRLLRRLFNKSVDRNKEMLFWPYGTIAYCPFTTRWWYRVNLIIWNTLGVCLKNKGV